MKKTKTNDTVPAVAKPNDAGKKRVGQVSPEERDEIKALFERKNALLELFKTMGDAATFNEALYEKVLADLGKVTTRSSQWWSAMSGKYQWESAREARWEINFEDCSIYLVCS